MTARKTQEQFERELLDVNPDIEVIGRYINSATKIACRCKRCGHEWGPTPSNVLSGTKCPKCTGHYSYTEEDVRDWLLKNTPTIELIGKFINVSTSTQFHCKKCGATWQTRPVDIRRGSRCPKCKNKYPTDRDDVEKALRKKSITLSDDFKNISSKATLFCDICGHSWSARVLDVLKTSGCPYCSNRYSPSPEEFRDWVRDNRPDITLLTDYAKSSKPLSCKCNVCGTVWKPRPADLKKGQGCPKCGRIKAPNSRMRRAGIKLMKELEITRPDITFLEEYKGSQVNIRCRCNICNHEWYVQPISIQQGHGCPNCAKNQTSFMEQFIYNTLVSILGPNAVENRNRSLIGKELDILIPSYNLAVEIGSWAWHFDKIDNDASKQELCRKKDVLLITIIDSCPLEVITELPDAWLYRFNLASEDGFKTLKSIALRLLDLCNIDCELYDFDWDEIIKQTALSSKKDNTSSFVELMATINPNITVLGEYVSTGTPILCRCNVCGHEWSARPADLKRGIGCRNCANMNNRISNEEFQQWVKNYRPTIELLTPYVRSSDPIQVKCKKCGYEWSTTPTRLKAGSGCASCAGTRRRTNAEFIEQISMIHPDISVLSEYKNNKSKIQCQCKNCNSQWEVTALSLLRGDGKCPHCKKRKTNHRV